MESSHPETLNKTEGGAATEVEQLSENVAEEIDLAAEKRLLRKVDWHLIPILFVLYLAAFIDRVNIGNARIQGLEADLNMTGNDFNIALLIFFVFYILCEVPSNLLLKRVRPSRFLAAIITSWGIITICQGLTQSFGGLIACRLLLGLFEAGFFPGCLYLISMYYKRHELQVRVNIFFCASILAGAFSGLLAFAIAHMDGVRGYSGWRWIFILEGTATVVLALSALWIIPDWPHTAKFLTPEERIMLETRLRRDVEGAAMNTWNKKAARRAFGDLKIYLGMLVFLGITTTTYSISFFTPTILRQLGWTSLRAQLMSIPIFAVAAVCTLSVAVLSDIFKQRYIFLMCGCLLAIAGYGILMSMLKVAVAVRYFAIFLICSGGFIAQPISLVWLSNNLSGHYKRGVGSAIQVGFGNISGIIASLVFLPQQAPTYGLGFGVGLGFLLFGMLTATAFYFYLRRENSLRDSGGRDDRFNIAEEEFNNLGDDHPRFRFTL